MRTVVDTVEVVIVLGNTVADFARAVKPCGAVTCAGARGKFEIVTIVLLTEHDSAPENDATTESPHRGRAVGARQATGDGASPESRRTVF
jgi:hypothetical protein